MVKTLFIAISFLFFSNLFAQLNGFVKENGTKKLIPYINIWVENEEIGTTSNEFGEYKLPETEKNKTLVFSAIGYETKRVKISNLKSITYLTPIDYQLSEVVIVPKKKPKTLKIGSFKYSNIRFYWAASHPWIIARYYPYKDEYANFPFLKSIKLITNCHSSDAKFNIRLYSVGENGEPKDYIYNQNIFATAKRISNHTQINLSKLNIQFPKNGFFVAVEWLIIEENKYEFDATIRGSNKKTHFINYDLSIGNINCETDEINYSFINGKWKRSSLSLNKKDYYTLAAEITLTE